MERGLSLENYLGDDKGYTLTEIAQLCRYSTAHVGLPAYLQEGIYGYAVTVEYVTRLILLRIGNKNKKD